MSNLIAKAMAGLFALVAVLALALFLSAGTFAYWQAWVFLGIWTLCVVLITLYLMRFDQRLLASRVQAGPAAEKQKAQQLIQSLASLAFIGLFVGAGLDRRNGWSHIPAWLSLLADLIVALGFYFVFLVFRENTYTSATIEVADRQKVISTGPYNLVRHPMYAGAGLLVLFSGIALGSWISVLFAIVLMFVIALRLLDEEKYLVTHLQGYDEYRRKVPYRLIPYIW